MTPILSIVIVNYNYGRFLEAAIQSVVNQDAFEKCELIVVDGGSTDNSVEIIKKYVRNISWWVSEKDGGQSDAFNKGFSHAKGRLLTWLNADDIMLPGVLDVVINAITRHPDFEWISGGMVFCDADMKVVQMRIGTAPPPLMPVKSLSMTIIGGPSSFFSAKRFREVGGFDVRLRYAMDGDLWWRLFMAGTRLHHIRKYFWAFRLHENSKTSPALLKKHLAGNHAIENAYLSTKNPRPRWLASVGVKGTAFWKLVNGSIIKSFVDTYLHKGLSIDKVFG